MTFTRKNILLFFTICSACLLFAHASVYAVDRPNILIMSEDADEDSAPRDSRLFKRVIDAVTNQIHDIGFDVYDETVVTLDHFAQGRIRRDRQELIDIGRSARQPPIDVVVSLSIYASMLDKGYTNKVKTRIEGQMIQVNSGKYLGSFEVVSPKIWTAPADCNRECVFEVAGEHSKILANDLGAVLGEKLAYLLDGSIGYTDGTGKGEMITDYNLVFDNFTAEHMMEIEEYLVVFSGYEAHRPVYSSARRAEIWYQSDIKSAKLLRNLNKMLERLDMRAHITYSGNQFTVEQTIIRTKKKPLETDNW